MISIKNNHNPAGEYEKAKTILVVEDDDSIGTFLVEVIAQETPYKAVLVTDGLQALKTVSAIKPSLCITDYCLPSMDGIELYDRLQASQELQGTPVILMSAYLPQQEVKKRKIVSLSKPFELDDLLSTMHKLLA